MKAIVPLTSSPGGRQIGTVEVDFESGVANGVMHLTNPADAAALADLLRVGLIDSISLQTNPVPAYAAELRDTLGPEVEAPRVKFSQQVEEQMRLGVAKPSDLRKDYR